MNGRTELSPERPPAAHNGTPSDRQQASSGGEALQRVVDAARSVVNCDYCRLYLPDPGEPVTVLRVVAAADRPADPENQPTQADETDEADVTVEPGRGAIGACWDNGQAVRVSGGDRRNELAVPLAADGETVGVVALVRRGGGRFTDRDEQTLIDVVATTAPAALAAIVDPAAKAPALLPQTSKETSVADVESIDETDPDNVDDLDDELTGLWSRAGYERRADQRSTDGPWHVALLDIDRFKAINDFHGHRCGDQVLQQMGEIVRAAAASFGLEAARLDGDEFVVFGGDEVELQRAMRLIQRQVRATSWEVESVSIEVAVSIGLAEAGEAADEAAVRANAAEALYLAKSQGRDQLVMFDQTDPQLHELRSDRTWADEVARAIETDSFMLYGQPIVPSSNPYGPAAYFEALLRYASPDGAIVSPGRLLAAADRFGLSKQLDSWIIERSLAWLAKQPESMTLAVNVTAPFLASASAIGSLRNWLNRLDVDPARLCLEIPEATAVDDLEQTRIFVRTTAGWGCRTAIDDFGSRWNLLPIIDELDIDIIKIDGTWIQRVTTDPQAATVVSSTMEAAKAMGVDVVAEWVEDASTMAFLAEIGVPYLQGFLFGVPRPLTEIAEPHEE